MAPRQRLSDLLEQKDLRGAEQEKAPILATVGEQFHRVEEAGLLLNLVEDDETRAMIHPSDGIGREAKARIFSDAARFRGECAAGVQPAGYLSRPGGSAGPRSPARGPGSIGVLGA